MTVLTFSPEANYLSRNNIVAPKHLTAAKLAADESRARAEFQDRVGLSLTGGSIAKEK